MIFLFCIFIVLFFMVFLFIIITLIKRFQLPLEIESVKVVGKKKHVPYPTELMPAKEIGKNWYYIIFEINGINKEFLVNRTIYNNIQEGDIGKLHHKKDFFIDFIKEN